MRSRYGAFALGLAAYLLATLAHGHPDRLTEEGDPGAFARALAETRRRHRYLDLRILEARQDGDHGVVLFVARIFERGTDRSFAELSEFTKEDGRWKYARGTLLPRARFPVPEDQLTSAVVMAAAEAEL